MNCGLKNWSLLNLVCVAGCFFALSDSSFACSTRHFYNNSNVNFYVGFISSGSTCSLPNSPNVSYCTVPPGKVAELHYSDLGALGTISIRSDGNVYPYTNFDFNSGSGVACNIHHHGNTGNIAVNEPAGGDVTTCGKGWHC